MMKMMKILMSEVRSIAESQKNIFKFEHVKSLETKTRKPSKQYSELENSSKRKSDGRELTKP